MIDQSTNTSGWTHNEIPDEELETLLEKLGGPPIRSEPTENDVIPEVTAPPSRTDMPLDTLNGSCLEQPNEGGETPEVIDKRHGADEVGNLAVAKDVEEEEDEFAGFINPEVGWLIKDIVMEAELFLLYGAEQAGKTFIATSLAIALSLGKPWMGREVVKASQVVYVATESLQDVVKRLQTVRDEVFHVTRCGVN